VGGLLSERTSVPCHTFETPSSTGMLPIN